ncbi:MAG: hypothetical protein VB142_02980 [Burkholderia sp.]
MSEQLVRAAAAFKVIRTIRRKMLCPSCGHIEQPPMPGLPIERSIAHPCALAPGNGKTLIGRFWVYARDDRRSGATEPAGMVRLLVGPQRRLPSNRGSRHSTAFCSRMPTPDLDQLYASMPSSDSQTLLAMIGERYGIEADIWGKPTR